MKNFIKYMVFSISLFFVMEITLTAYTNENITRFNTETIPTTYADKNALWLDMETNLIINPNSNDTWFNMGKSMKEVISQESNYQDIVALVNGQEINKRDLEGMKIVLPLFKGRIVSGKEALDKCIRYIVVIQETQKRGIYPSKEETLAFIESQMQMLEDAYNSDTDMDWEYVNYYQTYLSGLGITEEEFWTSEETVEAYQDFLAGGQLRYALTVEWKFYHTRELDQDSIVEFEQLYQKTIDQMVKSADIRILDTDALQ